MKPYVIVNPMAANGSVGRNWADLRALLERELGDFDFAMTQSATHGTALARKALESGYRNLGSLGGDGTHSLVVNGFFDDKAVPLAEDATLSVLPVGTGGDFRRMLKVGGKKLGPYAQAMKRDSAVPIDVGRVTYTTDDGDTVTQTFLNVCSFGVGGLVDRIVNSSSKALGKATYLLGSARGILSYRAPRVKITLDGETIAEDRMFLTAVCNGGYFGGGMNIGPEAVLDDGLFEVVVMAWKGRMSHLINGSKVYSGKHVNLPGVRVHRGKHLRAEADGECLIDLDGEAPGRLPAEFQILPNALRLKGL